MKQHLLLFTVVCSLSFGSIPEARSQWVQAATTGGKTVRAFATIGNDIFAGTDGGGVYRSTDKGSNWVTVNTGLSGSDVYALATIGTVLFAGTSNGGVFITTNSGTNWKQVNYNLGNTAIYALASSGTNLFAGTYDGGMFRTIDSGAIWYSAGGGLPIPYMIALAAIGPHVFVATRGEGVFRTVDSGGSWESVNDGLQSYCFAVDGSTLYAGNGNVNRSSDDGATWMALSNGLTNTGGVLAITFRGKYLFAGTYYNGVFSSGDSGASWTAFNADLTDNAVFALASTSTTLFAGTGSSGIWKRPLLDLINPASVNLSPSKASATIFPNPFAESTTVRFSLSNADQTQVIIVNLLGEEVARLFSGELAAGEHSFSWDARGMPAGIYLGLVQSNGNVERIPMLIVR